MKHNITKFFTRLALVAGLGMLTAANAWAASYSKTYDYSELKDLMPSSGNWLDANGYIKIPNASGHSEWFTIPIENGKQPTSNITLTFSLATFGQGNNPSSSNTTITAEGSESSSNWSGSGVSNYPSSSTYVNGVMTITKPTNPTTLSGLTITMGVNTEVKIFRFQSLTISYTYSGGGTPTTYTVTYNSNGGSGTMTDSNSPYNSGATVTVLANSFTRENYTFSKWNTAADGTGTDYDGGDTFAINANTTLYAQWTANSGGSGNGDTLVFDFEDDSAHRTSGNNSYDSNTYSENGVTISLTYADAVTSGTPLSGSANVMGRVAKNTTNSPVVLIGPIDISNWTISKIEYKTKGVGAMAQLFQTSLDGSTWTTQKNLSPMPTSATTETVSGLSITGSNLYLRWTVSVSSSTNSNRDFQLDDVVITYTAASSSLDPSDLVITNQSTDLAFDLYNNASAQVINYTTSSTGTITISPASPTSYFSYEHNASAKTITVTPLAVTPSSQTVTISQAADNTYSGGTATFTVAVANNNPNAPGSQNNPYTVAQARAAIDAGTGTTGVYATGIVSEIVWPFDANYGNISYNISADGTTTGDQLQAYRGKSYNGNSFTSANDILVGDEVVVYGNLIKHGSTYEFEQDNQLVSLVRPDIPSIVAEDVTIEYDATSGEIAYSISNPTEGTSLAATCSADWISNIVVTSTKVTFTATANEGNADRTATFTLTYTGATSKTVTVTQKHYIPDFATLPFEWAGGASAAFKALAGVTTSTLGSDYAASNSPYLIKFSESGQYIQVKTDSQPDKVTIGVKMLGGDDTSTITVQASADGTSFRDIEALTISGDKNDILTLETTNSFAASDRYVKLVFTKGSNVGVGPITITKHSDAPSIVVTPASANPAATDIEGTLDIEYENLTISDMTDFGIQFCDSEGTALTSGNEPSWIEALVAEQDPSIGAGYVVSYIMDTNLGEARSAYFKVFALGTNDYVYSNLVTITQAAQVCDYASLPFAYDGDCTGELPTGLTQEGLGEKTYNTSPKIGFNTSGDWLVLKMNEAPSTLSFYIKGNSFSGGTFKVQTSADGVTYTDLETYTELDGTILDEEFNLSESVRYIRWIYTEKVSGNVALGNIEVTKKADPESITLNAKYYNGRYWATFFNGVARYVLPEGAQAFTMNASHQLYRLGTDGSVIPANTAVVILVDPETSTANTKAITLNKSTDTDAIAVHGGTNILEGFDIPTTISGAYVLGIVTVGGESELGFFPYNGTGDNAKIPANKAYYVVSE